LKVKDVINRALSLFSDSIADVGIQVHIEQKDSNLLALVYEADLLAATLNILDNAVHWLTSNERGARNVWFTVEGTKKYVRLMIANDGPNIDARYVERLFSPGFSLKTEGSGIGLAIAREAMRSSKGDVAFDSESERTTFVIEMRNASKD
jgi:signal transduction histidine kinase